MSRAIAEILSPAPWARPRIHAYPITARAHKGLVKVRPGTCDVNQRVALQMKGKNEW